MTLPDFDTPEEIKTIIQNEVDKDIKFLKEDGDEESASFYQSMLEEIKQGTYTFLSWINKTEKPNLVLYPASGLDIIPKLSFGQNKVVHTSLEEYRGDNIKYFDNLGEGMKVIADNNFIPFRDESFSVICLLDSPEMIIGDNIRPYLKALKQGGLILVIRNILTVDDTRIEKYSEVKELESIPIPDQLQQQGEAELEFAVFRKINSI